MSRENNEMKNVLRRLREAENRLTALERRVGDEGIARQPIWEGKEWYASKSPFGSGGSAGPSAGNSEGFTSTLKTTPSVVQSDES
ncbi:hypothetical protein [Tsukamurella soli]|uniref:Transposase n=1 Tax=Tsukamurella soli TaxID=644556 RepID=A0ABP8JJ90_9ACTN